MRKFSIYILATMGAILIFTFLTWALIQHGTTGLLHVNQLVLYAFILFGAAGLLLIALTLLHWRLSRRPGRRGLAPLSIFLIAASGICLVAIPLASVILAGFPSANIKQSPPQLPVRQPLPGALHFAVGSDAHFGAGSNSPAETAKMLKQIADPSNRYDLFFFLGDLVQFGFLDSQWKEALRAFSEVSSAVPTRFAPGNHDTLFSGLKHYESYCSPPSAGAPGNSRLWYRLDVGKIHFLVLDIEWSAESYTAEQANWLESQLQSIPAEDWKIVMSHGFYYASGTVYQGWKWYDNPETISRLTPLFEKYAVDLVFSGHNHDLEFLQKSGVTYAVCGGFGGIPDPPRTYTSSASLWYLAGQSGFVEVELTGNQAAVDFRGPDSNLIKSFSWIKSR